MPPFASSCCLMVLSTCFRVAFTLASEQTKKRVANRFAEMLRTEASEPIRTYGDAFFRAIDLEFVSPSNLLLIKDHLLARLKDSPPDALHILEGIGAVLDADDAMRFIDPLVIAYGSVPDFGKPAMKFVAEESGRMPDNTVAPIVSRLHQWREFYEKRGQKDAVEAVERLRFGIEVLR